MRLGQLHLTAFGQFTDRVLDFGTPEQNLVFVHGANEAGKSTTLRAISDLRYGIHPQSRDNFVHQHRDMRLGGILLDGDGAAYTVVRRKGNKATLTYADGSPVPPEIEALITCGLSKEEYEAMFGLDHARLRAGGEALLAGEGEIGAALFEASAGVRSIPGILDKLDAVARTYYVARGKTAKINEAVRQFGEHHSAYRDALVKPAEWHDLFKRQQAAQEKVVALEERQRTLHRSLHRITELRAVAPLLRTFDTATETLSSLAAVPLLSETAVTDRASAQAGLDLAAHHAKLAAAQTKSLRERLANLTPDTQVLAVAAAVERFAAQVESIDSLTEERAQAKAEIASQDAQLASVSRSIDPVMPIEQLLQHAPKQNARTAIMQVLRTLETAQERLAQHRVSAGDAQDDAPGSDDDALPSPQVRAALRHAQAAVIRQDAVLKRKQALPAEMRAVQRSLDADLAALDLTLADLARVRPLLDSEIDAARTAQDTRDTKQNELHKRIRQINDALHVEGIHRGELLADGAVPTQDDVAAARARRDALVVQLRERSSAPRRAGKTADLLDTNLWQEFQAASVEADGLIDALARDTKRATQLQACQRKIADLERDREALQAELDRIAGEGLREQERWDQLLAKRQLPSLAPAALREWQDLLSRARAYAEELEVKEEELQSVDDDERQLVSDLRAAIAAVADGHVWADDLNDLCAQASAMEDQIKQAEKAANTAAGKREERAQQRELFTQQEKQLVDALARAERAAEEVYADLLLPKRAGVAAACARLDDFEALLAAHAAVDAARSREQRAEARLCALQQQGATLAQSVGEPAPSDIRLYGEQLLNRLKRARETDSARHAVEQGLEQALSAQQEHQETADRHARTLEALCRAAGVAGAEQLPQAEEQSRRKREAQADIDRTRKDLATASSRPIAELRTLLGECDPARMDADEAALQQELSQVDDALRGARAAEETARRALDAVDASDVAVAQRQQMERASAAVGAAMTPWVRSRLAYALLDEALKRFRDRAQGPMLQAASAYFECMTDGQFDTLISDDNGNGRPTLYARRRNSSHVGVDGMSEGTRDQLYLALRLAALGLRRAAGYRLPVVLDDVLITSDDARASHVLCALHRFALDNQVILFTHHSHLVDVAEKCVPARALNVVAL